MTVLPAGDVWLAGDVWFGGGLDPLGTFGVGLAALAGWLAAGRPQLHRLANGQEESPRDLGTARARTVLVLAVLATALVAGAGPVVLVLLVGLLGLLTALRARLRRRRAEDRVRAAVVEACLSFGTSLRVGAAPDEALARVGGELVDLSPLLRPVLNASRLGGDVPATLRRAAGHPGADGLRLLAAGWQVATDNGVALAQVVDRVGHGLRAQQTHRREVAAQLAGPRATARLLAALPVFGLLLGGVMGARPLHVLFETQLGVACLVVGVALDIAGLGWVEWLARRAEASA